MKYYNLVIFVSIAVLTAASAHANTSTGDFVRKASIANEFEIETSQLALDRSTNNDVTSFAQHMIDDHSETGDKFKEVLESSNSKAMPPEGLDTMHQKMLDKLSNTSDRNFDNNYIAMQIDAHKQAVKLFSDYSRYGKNSVLRNFASETLPTLKEHLQQVKRLKANY
jgi:putative membrane protein